MWIEFNDDGTVTYSFKRATAERNDFQNLTAKTAKAYRAMQHLLEESCIDTKTNKILRQSYLEKYDPSIFDTEKYRRKLLTKEEIEKYMRITTVYLTIQGKVFEKTSLVQVIEKNTKEFYKDEDEYIIFNSALQKRVNSNNYKSHDPNNLYHADGGFKKALAKKLGLRFEYSPNVSSKKLYLYHKFMKQLTDDLLVDKTTNSTFIQLVREKDVAENLGQYVPIDYKIALVVTLNRNWRPKVKSLLEEKEDFVNFRKNAVEENFIKYNGTENDSRDNSINPDDPNQVQGNNLTVTPPTPKKRPAENDSNSTSNTPNKRQVHKMRIPEGLEVPAGTKPKAPTNPTEHSIDKILKQEKEKKQNQGFYR